MTTQPPEYVGTIAALMFAGMVVFFTIKSYIENTTITTNDLFTIGYIEESQNQNITNIVCQANTPIDTKLHLDCIDTLVAVGYKKSIAKKMVIEYFKYNTASTVQEFISKVLKP